MIRSVIEECSSGPVQIYTQSCYQCGEAPASFFTAEFHQKVVIDQRFYLSRCCGTQKPSNRWVCVPSPQEESQGHSRILFLLAGLVPLARGRRPPFFHFVLVTKSLRPEDDTKVYTARRLDGGPHRHSGAWTSRRQSLCWH